jgi:RNA recognition motif-containing protein
LDICAEHRKDMQRCFCKQVPAREWGFFGGAQARNSRALALQAAVEKEAQEKKKKPAAVPRMAGGQRWWDPTLTEWPQNDFRIFVGDLGNEVNDDVLTKAFQKYTSFAKAKVVRDKHSNKSKGAPMELIPVPHVDEGTSLCPALVHCHHHQSERVVAHLLRHGVESVSSPVHVERVKSVRGHAGYGFVSFTDPIEGAKALKEMNGKYVGNRPCKLRKSTWDERTNTQALNKKRKAGQDAKPYLNLKKHVGVLHR